MLIKNYLELARTPLRDDALVILNAGFEAIETASVVRAGLRVENGILHVQHSRYVLAEYENIYFIGIGKCSADAAEVMEDILGEYLTGGYVLDIQGALLSILKNTIGTHPLPSKTNVEATRSIIEMLQGATERDLVISVISGGGSALLCLPHDMECETLSNITHTLMAQGATIDELNIVRKHTSEINGGRFVEFAYPAQVLSLIFSDVPGDDISTIASGPTVMDMTTIADAERIMMKYDVRKLCALPECALLETPKEKHFFERVENILFVTNKTALEAMRSMAIELGYGVEVDSLSLEGEAQKVGGRLALAGYGSNTCNLFGGETTVVIREGGSGKGGRNQEVALGALIHIPDDTVIISAASDGNDNSQVAGALVDRMVYTIGREKGLDPGNYLLEHNSYNFFEKTDGHIVTGKTGSNVSDLFIVLKK